MSSKIIEQVTKWIAERDVYCERKGYPKELTHPAGNWATDAEMNSIHDLFHQVISGDERVLKQLRLFSQPFSGYDLNRMEVLDGRVEDAATRNAEYCTDPWVQRYHTIARFIPQQYRMSMPAVLGERGVPEPNGGFINHDAYAYQERLNLLYESGVLRCLNNRSKAVTIVEIGGGFGGLAYGLLKALNIPVRYVLVDLPESLLYAALYLEKAIPKAEHTLGVKGGVEGILYVPNYRFDEWLELNPQPIDLAINTLSLVEMNDVQMAYYARTIRQCIGNSGLFFEQNHDGRWLGLKESKSVLSAHFPHGVRIESKTVPAVVNGRPDLWANVPLDLLQEFQPRPEELPGFGTRLRMLFSDKFWIQLRFLQALQRMIPPPIYANLKSAWNKLGGRMAR